MTVSVSDDFISSNCSQQLGWGTGGVAPTDKAVQKERTEKRAKRHLKDSGRKEEQGRREGERTERSGQENKGQGRRLGVREREGEGGGRRRGRSESEWWGEVRGLNLSASVNTRICVGNPA